MAFIPAANTFKKFKLGNTEADYKLAQESFSHA
jgi:hypothetical protein